MRIFEVFRAYDEGSEEETGVEAVVLMDVSGSMSSVMAQASGSVWVLKRAFDRLGIRTTAIVFDTAHYVLYQPSEKAQSRVPIVETLGGTDPTSALVEAHKILNKSFAPNKVLITVTDGSWSGPEDKRLGIMRHLHQQGVTTMLLGLDGALTYGKRGHQVGHDIKSVVELPKAALKLVAELLRKKVTSHD